MKKALDRMFDEIKRGENLDLYLTILLAVVIALLGIFQVANFEILSAVILAILGLLASSLLVSRRTITEVKSSFDELASASRTLQEKISNNGHISDFFIRSYPELSGQLQTAKRVSIEGSTLRSTVTYLAELKKLLQRGGSLRILVSEPVPEVLAMQVFRSSSIKDPVMMTNDMNSQMAMMKSLAEKAQKEGQFEIKTMPYLASYSILMIENDDGVSKIFVKLLPFQRAEKESPAFEIDSQHDTTWFSFFNDQFEKMWLESKSVLKK